MEELVNRNSTAMSFDAPSGWTRISLPRPLEDAVRDPRLRSLVDDAWVWHEELARAVEEGSRSSRPAAVFNDSLDPIAMASSQARRAFQNLIDSSPSVEEHLRQQIAGAKRLAGRVRLSDAEELDAFVRSWTGAHARALGVLTGIGGYSWQERLLDEASRGFFMTAALMTLPADVRADRILFPLSDAEGVDVDLDDLNSGRATAGVKRFLWKQVIRARDSFAQSQRLVDDLDRRGAASFRRWWFASLEILNIIEKNGFDIWRYPPHLSRYQLAHVRFQARFGRTTFR